MKPIFCNPLNLAYRYQCKQRQAEDGSLQRLPLFREGADPTVLLFKGVYLLFVSMSGGFWYSEDLLDWRFRETPELPVYDYAPDVRQIGDCVVFSASRMREPCALYRSEDPLRKPFEPMEPLFPFWDPDLFQDDDGRVYLYWGCSNETPLYGQELDRATLRPLGVKQALVRECMADHGWERCGENNAVGKALPAVAKPYIEGSFLTKHGGRYYLQYAAPGTEFNVYANGVYVSDSPLGPFEYQAHNPFSLVPGGFITGAGHGSTFRDKQGQWWHAATMRISVHDSFERRVGLFPCEFDEDGTLHCQQAFADYPQSLTRSLASDEPLWMLLSLGKRATASSSVPGHEAARGVEEDVRTWWAADSADANPWYCLDLGRLMDVCAVQVNFADHEGVAPEVDARQMCPVLFERRAILPADHPTEYLLEASADGDGWQVLQDRRGTGLDCPHDLVVPEAPVHARYLRLSHLRMPFGMSPAVSGLRVFGRGSGPRLAPVQPLRACRTDDVTLSLAWKPVEGADGYLVRYGAEENKLYSSWLLYGRTELDIGTLNRGVPCYVAIDSFNENGVTRGVALAVPDQEKG